MRVLRMHQKIVKMPQSEATKLRARLADLKSERRSLKMRLTNLRGRAADLVGYLDDYIVPTLNTTRKKMCEQHIRRVRTVI